MLALLGGLTGPALAQDDEEGETPQPAYIAGEMIWTDGQDQGCMNDLLNVCGKTFAVSADMDDRRLSGQGLAPMTGPLAPVRSFAHRGSLRIENADGAWDGIVSIADRPGVYGVWLVGEEAYEGLTAFLYAISVSTEEGERAMDWEVEGWLFEAELPPLPEPSAIE